MSRTRIDRCVLVTLSLAAFLLALGTGVDARPVDADEWIRLTGAGFVVFSNATEQTAHDVASEFATFRATVEAILPALEHRPLRPIHIYVFRNGGTFEQFGPNNRRVGGYFFGTSTINYIAMNAAAGDPAQIIRHEYVHYMLSNNFPYMPRWLNEGLAHYFEGFRIAGGEAHVGLFLGNMQRYLRFIHDWVPLKELLSGAYGSVGSRDPKTVVKFRTQSWALVHFLFVPTEERRQQTSQVLALLSEGVPSDCALTQVFGMSLPKLQNTLRKHVRSPVAPHAVFPLDELDADTDLSTERMTRLEVLCRLGDLLLLWGDGKRSERARRYFDEALTLSPDHPPALTGKATLLSREGEQQTALALVHRAIEREPSNAITHFVLGAMLLEQFDAEGGEVPPRGGQTSPLMIQARDAFRRAFEIDPFFVAAYNNYGHTFIYDAATQAPGIDVVTRALQRFPSLTLTLTLLELHSRTGDLETARRIHREHIEKMMGSLGTHEERALDEIKTAVLRADLLVAQAWAEEGRCDEALILLRSMRGKTSDDELKREIDRKLEDFTKADPSGSDRPTTPAPDE